MTEKSEIKENMSAKWVNTHAQRWQNGQIGFENLAVWTPQDI